MEPILAGKVALYIHSTRWGGFASDTSVCEYPYTAADIGGGCATTTGPLKPILAANESKSNNQSIWQFNSNFRGLARTQNRKFNPRNKSRANMGILLNTQLIGKPVVTLLILDTQFGFCRD